MNKSRIFLLSGIILGVFAFYFLDSNTEYSAPKSFPSIAELPALAPSSSNKVVTKSVEITAADPRHALSTTKPSRPSTQSETTNPDHIAIKNEIIAVWDLSHSPPEPTPDNAERLYGGPFEDQIDLYNSEDNCSEDICVETLSQRIPSNGPYAEQINTTDLEAQNHSADDEYDPIPLITPPPYSGPPTDS